MIGPTAQTVAQHHTDIAPLINATTTAALAIALAAWQPTDGPGFADDLPDGLYFDGLYFATKRGQELAVTRFHDLPAHTLDLRTQLDEEQRDAAEEKALIDAVRTERRAGRPAIGKPLPVRLPDWRRRTIAEDAAAAGVADAELVRWLIGEAYQQLSADAAAAGCDRADLIRARMAARTA